MIRLSYRILSYLFRKFKKISIKLKLIFFSILSNTSLSNSEGVVISLTSYYKRFSTLYLTLESLFQQKTKYSFQVSLVISQEDISLYGGLPKNIEKYIERGLNLIIVEENLKSYKKAFYTLELNEPLITVDDDVYYPEWWLDNLLNQVEFYPDTVLAYRGHYILSDNDGFKKYESWLNESDNFYLDKGSYSFLPTGTSGVYYPAGALNGLNESKEYFLKLCPTTDDLWFKYLTTINGFKSKRIQRKNIHFIILGSDKGLCDINILGGGNDTQFNNLLDFSNEFYCLIKTDTIMLDDK